MPENPALATPRDQQPASEWASTTLSALDPANDIPQAPQVHSPPETPGLSMPGSFPIPKQGLVAPDIQGVASDALKTAKEYAQMASQGAQNAVQTAGGKVGGYLPTSVASYLCELEYYVLHVSMNLISSSTRWIPGGTATEDTLPGNVSK